MILENKRYCLEHKDEINKRRSRRRKAKAELRHRLVMNGKLRTTGECRACGVDISANRRYCLNCRVEVRASTWRAYTEKNRNKKKTYEYKYSRRAKQAKLRNIPWLLSYEDFVLITSDMCHYCDSSSYSSMGIDRLDSFKPYEVSNCVPCCRTCNQIKNQNLDEKETLCVAMALREFRENREPEVTKTGCVKVPVKVFDDSRGFFTEVYSEKLLSVIGQKGAPSQINCSSSYYDVVRGMHYNPVNPQSKLVRVLSGEIIDCVIDLRYGSDTFGQMECFYLSNRNYALYIPKGFAHGFWSREEDSIVMYSCWGLYDPNNDAGISPLDETFSFPWLKYGKTSNYRISAKDSSWSTFDKNINVVPSELSEFVDGAKY